MAPDQPPLPTATSLLFQPDTGIQTSIFISESVVGLRVAATRQNAGRLVKSCAEAPSGSRNSPGATSRAREMVVFGRLSEPRLSHVAAIAKDAHANARPEHLIIGSAYYLIRPYEHERAAPAGARKEMLGEINDVMCIKVEQVFGGRIV